MSEERLNIDEYIAEKIRFLRNKYNIQISDLAKELNVSNDFLIKIENGLDSCKMEHLFAIAKIFSKDVNYFLPENNIYKEFISLFSKLNDDDKMLVEKIIDDNI